MHKFRIPSSFNVASNKVGVRDAAARILARVDKVKSESKRLEILTKFIKGLI